MFSYGLPTLAGNASACACVVIMLPGGTNLLSAIVTPSVTVLDTPIATLLPTFALKMKLFIPTNVSFPTYAPISYVVTHRCGYGASLPMLAISPYAKVNFVDHSVTDQSSILRFIEDNWNLGHIGDQSFDAKAGSLLNMFNFTTSHYAKNLFLDPYTGLGK
jgi:hypothetical protein